MIRRQMQRAVLKYEDGHLEAVSSRASVLTEPETVEDGSGPPTKVGASGST